MAVISRASIQNLKSRIDIVDVVSGAVALKRAGSKFKGLSPFNPEKTPSFYVSPDKGLFKCFSSGKAGDAISFVMETERLGFTEAVETLAKRFNIPLEYERGGVTHEERSLRSELYELHETAADVFREAFLAPTESGRHVRAYWTEGRKFTLETAEDFKIGFAPPDGGGLADRLRRKGHSEGALRESGLFYPRAGGAPSPRFRGRLMIPIRDNQGRIVAFTARQMDVTPADDPTREAKYVNSPETPVFVKGALLFNLDRARIHASETRPFLMVEGQLDAIRCWTAGLTTAIAPQGTGVTETQLHLLRRHRAGIECLLDGDSAGRRAALRLLPLALKEGIEVTFLPIEGRRDPDDLVREGGAAAIETLRAGRLGAMAFAVQALAPRPETLTAQQLADACRELFAIIHQTASEIARSEYLGEVATLLRIGRSSIDADYRRFRDEASRRTVLRAATPAPEADEPVAFAEPRAPDGVGTVEHDLLLLILHFEAVARPLAHALEHRFINTSSRSGRLLDRFLNEIAHDLWPGAGNLEELLEDPEDRGLLASLLFERPAIDDPTKIANDGIRQMVSNFCGPMIRKIELEIAAKQQTFDAELIHLLRTADDLRRLKLHPPTIRPPA